MTRQGGRLRRPGGRLRRQAGWQAQAGRVAGAGRPGGRLRRPKKKLNTKKFYTDYN